uniref:RING-type domain-containing protein n=1 Tax=Acrobeloides nanus TaxID=290746 RepID=A0A914EEQ0_9BILA
MLGDCCICQNNLEDHLATLYCGHVFHDNCIEEAIRIHKKCPLCQKEFNERDIIKLITDAHPLREEYLPQEYNDIKEIIQLFSIQNRDTETPEEFKDLLRHVNRTIRATKLSFQQLTQEIYDEKKNAEQKLLERKASKKRRFLSFFRRRQ